MGPCSLLYHSWNWSSDKPGLGCIVTYSMPGVFDMVAIVGVKVKVEVEVGVEESREMGGRGLLTPWLGNTRS